MNKEVQKDTVQDNRGQSGENEAKNSAECDDMPETIEPTQGHPTDIPVKEEEEKKDGPDGPQVNTPGLSASVVDGHDLARPNK